MTRLILSTIAAVAALSLSAPAFASPAGHGNALSDDAAAGQLTPHGVWDGK